MTAWIKRWNTWIAPQPSKPGVWRRKEGGYLVRGRIRDPRTHKPKEIRFSVLDAKSPAEAYVQLQDALRQAQAELIEPPKPKPLFSSFVVSLLKEKIADGSIASAATRVKIGSVIKQHLIPAFGTKRMDEIKHGDVMEWRASTAEQIHAGTYSPNTANSWLVWMRVVFKAATRRFELPRNPMDGVDNFDNRLRHTYTEEEPNSLTAEEVRLFLVKMRELYPQHFAMVALGFATGWRPSSLRPLRRQGPQPDVLWDKGIILVRRSHTEFKEVMDATKTKRSQRVSVPPEVMEILKWHQDRLPEGKMQESDLLFPDENGELLDRGCLTGPFEEVSKELGLTKKITPRAMRRTFQDLARAANVNDLVTRSISGHATEAMQQHYSTVQQDEMRAGLAKVVSLAGVREALDRDGGESRGMHRGMHAPKSEKAG